MGTAPAYENANTEPRGEDRSSMLNGLGFQFCETMAGFLAVDETDPQKGVERGRNENTPFRFDVRIRIDSLGRFLRVMEHAAELTGTVTFAPLGGTFAIRDGRFNLFTVGPQAGVRQMTYAFRFTAGDGRPYYLQGQKKIHDDPSAFTPVKDMTTLFTVVYRGEDERSRVYGAGELYFSLADAPALVASMKVEGTTSWWRKAAALTAFTSFAYGVLRDEYLREARLFYDTQYENLALTGSLQTGGSIEVPFFFVSGVHERGFPWGDTGIFWDVVLAVGDGKGSYDRYCITDLVLEGLELDISEGTYHYHGPLFKLTEGYSTSFFQMRKKQPPLSEFEADFRMEFDAQPYDAVAVSFPLVPKLVRKLSSEPWRSGRRKTERPWGVAFRWGSVLRFALNAPPFGLRRASLQPEP